MTIEERQLDELVDLAQACRPHGAARWDAPGIKAALRNVQHMALGEVMRVVVVAAEDRELKTPAAIGNTSSPLWRRAAEPATQQPQTVAQRVSTGALCSVCSQPELRCRELWSDDHEYLSNDELRRTVAAQDPYVRWQRIELLRKAVRGFGELP